MVDFNLSLSALMDEVQAQSGVVVDFHDLSGLCLQIPNLALRHDQYYHHGDFCTFAKRMGNQPLCSANKQKSIEKAQAGEAYSGYCPFGIWDHAQPVKFENELIGIVFVGSAQGEQPLAEIEGQRYNGPALPQLDEALQQRCKELATFIAEHILLIIRAWIRQGNLLGKKKSEHFYVQAMHQFIEMHYPKDISLAGLAGQLRVHANYLGSLITRLSDKTFRQHLLDFRCQRAQVMLRSTNESITEIAYTCGFQDSNYFSTAFKREVGMSPRAYRQQHHD